MNQTIKTQLNHRTIRAFKDKPIDESIMSTLFDVANQTSTSMAMQSYSIIRVKDKNLRKELGKISNQIYLEQAPELLIFIVDCYRNAMISEEQGLVQPAKHDADRFIQGFTDGAIACQNLFVAAESLGIGGVYFGSILNNIEKVIELLELPKYTYPIVGLGLGYPDQDPELKPRMKTELKVFTDKYKKQDSYLESLKDYDKILSTYYDLRDTSKTVAGFTEHVKNVLNRQNPNRLKAFSIIKKQGFDL